ncbi:hypothetical protein ACA910_019803 [Epithemia clementina (nom. ined.)]
MAARRPEIPPQHHRALPSLASMDSISGKMDLDENDDSHGSYFADAPSISFPPLSNRDQEDEWCDNPMDNHDDDEKKSPNNAVVLNRILGGMEPQTYNPQELSSHSRGHSHAFHNSTGRLLLRVGGKNHRRLFPKRLPSSTSSSPSSSGLSNSSSSFLNDERLHSSLSSFGGGGGGSGKKSTPYFRMDRLNNKNRAMRAFLSIDLEEGDDDDGFDMGNNRDSSAAFDFSFSVNDLQDAEEDVDHSNSYNSNSHNSHSGNNSSLFLDRQPQQQFQPQQQEQSTPPQQSSSNNNHQQPTGENQNTTSNSAELVHPEPELQEESKPGVVRKTGSHSNLLSSANYGKQNRSTTSLSGSKSSLHSGSRNHSNHSKNKKSRLGGGGGTLSHRNSSHHSDGNNSNSQNNSNKNHNKPLRGPSNHNPIRHPVNGMDGGQGPRPNNQSRARKSNNNSSNGAEEQGDIENVAPQHDTRFPAQDGTNGIPPSPVRHKKTIPLLVSSPRDFTKKKKKVPQEADGEEYGDDYDEDHGKKKENKPSVAKTFGQAYKVIPSPKQLPSPHITKMNGMPLAPLQDLSETGESFSNEEDEDEEDEHEIAIEKEDDDDDDETPDVDNEDYSVGTTSECTWTQEIHTFDIGDYYFEEHNHNHNATNLVEENKQAEVQQDPSPDIAAAIASILALDDELSTSFSTVAAKSQRKTGAAIQSPGPTITAGKKDDSSPPALSPSGGEGATRRIVKKKRTVPPGSLRRQAPRPQQTTQGSRSPASSSGAGVRKHSNPHNNNGGRGAQPARPTTRPREGISTRRSSNGSGSGVTAPQGASTTTTTTKSQVTRPRGGSSPPTTRFNQGEAGEAPLSPRTRGTSLSPGRLMNGVMALGDEGAVPSSGRPRGKSPLRRSSNGPAAQGEASSQVRRSSNGDTAQRQGLSSSHRLHPRGESPPRVLSNGEAVQQRATRGKSPPRVSSNGESVQNGATTGRLTGISPTRRSGNGDATPGAPPSPSGRPRASISPRRASHGEAIRRASVQPSIRPHGSSPTRRSSNGVAVLEAPPSPSGRPRGMSPTRRSSNGESPQMAPPSPSGGRRRGMSPTRRSSNGEAPQNAPPSPSGGRRRGMSPTRRSSNGGGAPSVPSTRLRGTSPPRRSSSAGGNGEEKNAPAGRSRPTLTSQNSNRKTIHRKTQALRAATDPDHNSPTRLSKNTISTAPKSSRPGEEIGVRRTTTENQRSLLSEDEQIIASDSNPANKIQIPPVEDLNQQDEGHTLENRAEVPSEAGGLGAGSTKQGHEEDHESKIMKLLNREDAPKELKLEQLAALVEIYLERRVAKSELGSRQEGTTCGQNSDGHDPKSEDVSPPEDTEIMQGQPIADPAAEMRDEGIEDCNPVSAGQHPEDSDPKREDPCSPSDKHIRQEQQILSVLVKSYQGPRTESAETGSSYGVAAGQDSDGAKEGLDEPEQAQEGTSSPSVTLPGREQCNSSDLVELRPGKEIDDVEHFSAGAGSSGQGSDDHDSQAENATPPFSGSVKEQEQRSAAWLSEIHLGDIEDAEPVSLVVAVGQNVENRDRTREVIESPSETPQEQEQKSFADLIESYLGGEIDEDAIQVSVQERRDLVGRGKSRNAGLAVTNTYVSPMRGRPRQQSPERIKSSGQGQQRRGISPNNRQISKEPDRPGERRPSPEHRKPSIADHNDRTPRQQNSHRKIKTIGKERLPQPSFLPQRSTSLDLDTNTKFLARKLAEEALEARFNASSTKPSPKMMLSQTLSLGTSMSAVLMMEHKSSKLALLRSRRDSLRKDVEMKTTRLLLDETISNHTQKRASGSHNNQYNKSRSISTETTTTAPTISTTGTSSNATIGTLSPQVHKNSENLLMHNKQHGQQQHQSSIIGQTFEKIKEEQQRLNQLKLRRSNSQQMQLDDLGTASYITSPSLLLPGPDEESIPTIPAELVSL